MNLTLIVDGGWLMQSRFHMFSSKMQKDTPEVVKKAAGQEFKELMARSISVMLNRFPEIDNIVLTSEGGSWRKMLPIPEYIKKTTDITSYKGHRERDDKIDWDYAYKCYAEFAKNCEQFGVTHSQHSMIEGDDWVWYWSRKLNEEGKDTMIWSTDQDLKQLVQVKGGRVTVWYNDKNGMFIPNQCEYPADPIEAMMNPPFTSQNLELLKRHSGKYECIYPESVTIDKILCGDAGDNIKPIASIRKGARMSNFTKKDKDNLFDYLGRDLLTMEDFKDAKNSIITWISGYKKFAGQISKSDLEEMFEYNTKLVWLNESVLPDTYTKAMVQFELGECDVKSIKSNYRLLLGKNETVENIFDSIFEN